MGGGGINHNVKEDEPVLLVHLFTHTNLNLLKKGFRGWLSGEMLLSKCYRRDRCIVCGN